MIHRIAAVYTNPCSADANIRVNDICQAKSAIATVMIKAIGIVFCADQRKPISKIPDTKMGKKASKACSAMLS